MWVAIVLACSTQLATSCQVLANKSQLHYEESICIADSSKRASYLADAWYNSKHFKPIGIWPYSMEYITNEK